MALYNLFAKAIDRPIEGVIKADDEAHLRLEVEEYVLTNVVAKSLERFLEVYNDYQGANGVWISGFFGSGKSHLLKILALLLENREVDGIPALELFQPKLQDNPWLRAELEKAAAIPSHSVLFNIDQKADVISKTEFDALLAVFVKVFDEMCGYYGKQGYIAQFERDLDSRGLYGAFQHAYHERTGAPWERGREQALLEGPNIAAAYAQVTGTPVESAGGILDKYRADYRVSIEDFAAMVDDHIRRQEPNFRLNFFVDEVGQYIADNVKLMTNLQTVAESLATRSRGRAWLLVTAQEEMRQVFGDAGKQQSEDFSKIQARFATRMKLTSADVEEVIRKRLLTKNERGITLLSRRYEEEKNNFKTLFDFADGSQSYRNFRDRDHFVHTYPFVPYQFPLFQSAIQSLSQHNAFEGKHSSVGERSMLGVFQQVAVQIRDHEVGQLATFDLMFEGIRTALKSQIQRSVLTAERHLDDPFAVKLLKALFLVKYVKEFKATLRNLTVLMLDDFDADLPALRKRVEEALNLLEQQTYIQRNGEEYEYLTDEEKDVEQEIKNTEVDNTAVSDELGRLVFDYVIKDRKIRYDENGQDYPFSRKLDDRLIGREYELTIHVVSPFHQHAGQDAVLRSQAMGRDELLVLLPLNERLVRDLMLYVRTEKYVRQNITTAQQESVRRILTEKQLQNANRLQALRALVADMMGEATLVIEGRALELNGSEARGRIVRGFHDLLVRTYPYLGMLRGVAYRESDIAQFLQPSVTLYGEDVALVSEPEQEIAAFIQGNKRNALRTTMLSLVNHFERKPYGWYLAAIQCNLAKLIARGKVEVLRDGTILENHELERALGNTHGYGNLILEPQQEFTPAQVRALHDFYSDFFDGPPEANEAKALGKETAAAFQRQVVEWRQLQARSRTYPFLQVLQQPLAHMEEIVRRPYTYFLLELPAREDELFALKEQVLDPLRRFMSGPQRDIYDQARAFLDAQEANVTYLDGDGSDRLGALLDDPAVFSGSAIQEAKRLLDTLQEQVDEQIRQERAAAIAALHSLRERLEHTEEFGKLTVVQQESLREPFYAVERELAGQRLIAVMRERLRRFEASDYPTQLHRLTTLAAREDDEDDDLVLGEKEIQYVTRSSLTVDFDKPWLADQEDVERYLQALRASFMRVIEAGKRIHI
jgi:hypothetical protein